MSPPPLMPAEPVGRLLKLGLFLSRTFPLDVAIPSDSVFGVLRSHGLPAEYDDRIRAELALWWLPNFLIYPLAIIFSLVNVAGTQQQTDVDVGIAESLRQLAATSLAMAITFGIAFLFVAMFHHMGRGKVRRLLRDVVLCAEKIAEVHLENIDPPRPSHWEGVARERRIGRSVIKDKAWAVTGHLASLAGHRGRDRDRPPVNAFGRWLHWTAEDVQDARRLEGGLYACVDMMRYLLGPSPLAMPRLRKPPPEAKIVNPTNWHRWVSRATVVRAALLALLPLATAVLSFLVKVL